MTDTSTIIRVPDPGPGGHLAPGSSTTLPTVLTAQLRGVEREEDLASALATWRTAATVEGAAPRFVLAGRLGQGSQGVVFALRDRDCQRTVAFKAMTGREADPEDVARFLHEVQVTAQLEHPGVVPVHDVGILPDGTMFYTMKRVEGVVLSDWMVGRAGSAAHRFEVIQLLLKLCDTVAFAHSRGVIHRDLKPRNIMVGTYGEVLVMDWGLAKVLGREDTLRRRGNEVLLSEVADHETLQGTAVGTPAYMSPEQAAGELAAVDHRADIYSLGVLLYEMLTDTSPYVRGNMRRTVQQVVEGTWMRLDQPQARVRLPQRLVAIVHKAMALRPEDRYQHVSELAADLRAFLAGAAVSAHRESLAERLARTWDTHRRRISWIAAGSTVLVLAVGGSWWWQGRAIQRQVVELRGEAARAIASGDWSAARTANERVLAHLPDDREASLGAARADERLRSDAERRAKEETRADLDRRQRAQAAELRRRAAELAGAGTSKDFADAADLCNQARILNPDDRQIVADHATYLAELSRLRAEAAERQRQADGAAMRHAEAGEMTAKAEAEAAAGRLDEAVGLLLSAIELEPDPRRAERLGALAALRRQSQEAEARQRRRGEADVQLAVAGERLAAGDATAAQASLARAEALDAGHPGLSALRTRIADAQRQALTSAAEERVREAVRVSRSAAGLRVDLAVRGEVVRRLRAEVAEGGDPARRIALATAEDACRETAQAHAQRLAEAAGLLNRALAITPEHQPVRRALAEFWVGRLREAEDEGDLAAAAAAEAQARAYDDGANRDLLDGLSQVVNQGAGDLALVPIVRTPERTDAPSGAPVRIPAGGAAALPRGRYLATSSDGTCLAVRLERGRSHALALPGRPAGLPPEVVFIAGGELRDESGQAATRVAPYALLAREVTCGEWLEFLNDPATQEAISQAIARGELIYAPRSKTIDGEPLWRRQGFRGNGLFELETVGERSVAVNPACPVAHVSHDDAVAYAAWRARRDGRPWRLPTVGEWQFAVQGGDGRAQPWGDAADLLFCASSLAAARDASLARGAGMRFTTDRSVQGVWDLAGSRSEFCAGGSGLSADLRPLMGGSIYDRMPERFTLHARRDVDHRLVHPGWGVRLAYTP